METIGKIISADYRKARVLKALDIDFSIGGSKTIEHACAERGLDAAAVREQLAVIDALAPVSELHYSSWDAQFLIKYIVQIHHRQVSTQTRFLSEMAHKIAESNKARNPEIKRVADLFTSAGKTMELMRDEEENRLFPNILIFPAKSASNTGFGGLGFGGVLTKIYDLKADGEKVIDNFRHIRKLTNGYTVPPYSSSTCPILYRLLEAYDDDVCLHLHLENNILFPKVFEMESTVRSKRFTS